jgi:hypothetical protein
LAERILSFAKIPGKNGSLLFYIIELNQLTPNSLVVRDDNLVLIFCGAAVSGLSAIFYDRGNQDYFRIKNIPDIVEAHKHLNIFGLMVNDSVSSMKMTARRSLALNDLRSNIF